MGGYSGTPLCHVDLGTLTIETRRFGREFGVGHATESRKLGNIRCGFRHVCLILLLPVRVGRTCRYLRRSADPVRSWTGSRRSEQRHFHRHFAGTATRANSTIARRYPQTLPDHSSVDLCQDNKAMPSRDSARIPGSLDLAESPAESRTSTMCRLFGLHAGADPVTATFWLLDAPDSLREQSHREPDGAGIGVFDADGAAGHRQAADRRPGRTPNSPGTARTARSRTFVAHVRYASTGAHTVVNTHPFTQDGRLFAHNGAFGGLDQLDRRLAELGVDRTGRRPDRQRADVRPDHRGDRPQRRRSSARRSSAAVSWIAERSAGVRAESDHRHPRRAVGVALSGHPRALRAGSRDSRPRTAGGAQQAHPRPIRRTVRTTRR